VGDLRNSYKILIRKLEWKRPFLRYKCRWEDNIIIDPTSKVRLRALDSFGIE
jgi:hypothetical protein